MTSAVKTKKDVVAEFRTSGILEAARKVFAERGFHEATVDDIAEAAGVAKGTVYLYYQSKRDVYFAALKFGIAQMYSSLLRELKKVSTPEEKLKALIGAKLTYFDENRDFFRIYYSELGNIPSALPGGMDNEFKTLYQEQARLVESILKEGARKGAIRNLRTEQTAFAISDVIRGVVTHRILGWSKSKLNQDADFIFDMIWKGIAAQ
jgi:TetR/AcrR family fatty acid metabolism transcriptional regulator